jgi:hypothetical protein
VDITAALGISTSTAHPTPFLGGGTLTWELHLMRWTYGRTRPKARRSSPCGSHSPSVCSSAERGSHGLQEEKGRHVARVRTFGVMPAPRALRWFTAWAVMRRDHENCRRGHERFRKDSGIRDRPGARDGSTGRAANGRGIGCRTSHRMVDDRMLLKPGSSIAQGPMRPEPK